MNEAPARIALFLAPVGLGRRKTPAPTVDDHLSEAARSIGAAGVGQISSTARASRQIQFALKFIF